MNRTPAPGAPAMFQAAGNDAKGVEHDTGKDRRAVGNGYSS